MDEDKIIIYKTEDEAVSVDGRFDQDTVWLTLDQMGSCLTGISPPSLAM